MQRLEVLLVKNYQILRGVQKKKSYVYYVILKIFSITFIAQYIDWALSCF